MQLTIENWKWFGQEFHKKMVSKHGKLDFEAAIGNIKQEWVANKVDWTSG